MLYRSRDVSLADITEFRVDVRMGSLGRTLALVGAVCGAGVGGMAWLLVHLDRPLPPLPLLLGIPGAVVLFAVWLCPRTRLLAERMTREILVEHRHFLVLKSGFSVGFDQVAGVVLMKDPNGIEVGGLQRNVWGVALKAGSGGMLRIFFCTDEEKVRRVSAALTRVTASRVIEWNSALGRSVDEERSERFRRKRDLLLGGALAASNDETLDNETGPGRGQGSQTTTNTSGRSPDSSSPNQA